MALQTMEKSSKGKLKLSDWLVPRRCVPKIATLPLEAQRVGEREADGKTLLGKTNRAKYRDPKVTCCLTHGLWVLAKETASHKWLARSAIKPKTTQQKTATQTKTTHNKQKQHTTNKNNTQQQKTAKTKQNNTNKTNRATQSK